MQTEPSTRPIVVASNRGPVSFALVDGTPVARRGAGGLVSGLGPQLAHTEAIWVAACMTEGDRVMSRQNPTGRAIQSADGFNIALLDIDEPTYRQAYDTIGNSTLWFLHHGLVDWVPPLDTPEWLEAWIGFERYNAHFSASLAELAPDGAAVLLQDYHLSLVAPLLRLSRPDLRLVHFSHTPFARPDELGRLPHRARRQLLDGLSANHRCGFHTRRWADQFEECLAVDRVTGSPATSGPDVFVAPLSPDVDDIEEVASSAACQEAGDRLADEVGDLQVIVRVDRMEPTKNVLGGFDAYERLLDGWPQHRGAVTFVALVYPSRESIEAYRVHRDAVVSAIDRINTRFGTDEWTPVLFASDDDFPRAVAALRRYDLLLINPLRDGMNLVAKEGPIVNDRNGVLCLSTEAGAWPELGEWAIAVDPFDPDETASAIDRGLTATVSERKAWSEQLRRAATNRTPADWVADQLADPATGVDLGDR